MIRIKKKIGSNVPNILSTKGVEATADLIKKVSNGVELEFNSAIYAHSDVKEALRTLQYDKCCFCESKISHIAYGDVEHYRPKAGWVQNDEPINKPGYYWLAYDWDNLLLCCQICNQRYKKNYFPIQIEADRAIDHTIDKNKEKPLFIHPVNDDPEEHIEFNEDVPKAVNGSVKGMATIEKLGLDRELLNKQRKTKLNEFKIIYGLAIGHPDTEQKKAAKAFILKAQSENAEYSSMLRCFFKKNPINF